MSKKKAGNIRRARTPTRPLLLTRALYVESLHRRPRAWDVAAYELTAALAKDYWSVRQSLHPGALRIKMETLPAVSLMLARGFEVTLRQIFREDRSVAAAFDAGALDAARVARKGFDPLLRKFVEDLDGQIVPRREDGLARLVGRLEEALREFLRTHCAAGSDLHSALLAPLADAPTGFPDNRFPHDPEASTGSAARDVISLAPTVRDGDDLNEVKRKLLHFAREDPWLAEECYGYVLDRLSEPTPDTNEVFESYRATDDFLYRATRVSGRTPIELFIERQPDMPDYHRRMLLRWQGEGFVGVFHIRKLERPYVVGADVLTDREYRLLCTRAEAVDQMRRGDLFTARIIPWGEHWSMSGVQEQIGNVDAKGLPDVRRLLRGAPPTRPADPDDPKIKAGFKVQAEMHAAWVALFGTDEMALPTGRDLQEVMDRFYRHWGQELRDPETGMTRAERYERKNNRPAPETPGGLPREFLDARDVGVIVDPYHGTIFLSGYGLFRSALESQGVRTKEQVGAVLEYLTEPSVDYAVFLRARARYPRRLEELLRLALRDEEFNLEADFDALLRKYKGGAMRMPRRPDVTIVEPDDL